MGFTTGGGHLYAQFFDQPDGGTVADWSAQLYQLDMELSVVAEALVQPVDLFPTLCELADLEIPAGLQGQSFASVSESPTQSHRQFAISGRNLNDNWGTVPATVTDGVWSLQYWPNKDLAYKGSKPVRQETYPNTGMPERRVDELFDLRVDPDQSNNVLHEHPQEAARLHAALLELIELGETDAEVARTYEPLPGAG